MFAGSVLRLSDDAMRLELSVTAALLRMSRADVQAAIQDECRQMGIVLLPTAEQIATSLVGGRLGRWILLSEGLRAVPAVDSRVELTIHVRTTSNQAASRVAVKAGTVLARWYPAVPGSPGQTLLGQVLSVRPPKSARLPKGPNTTVQDDGCTLVATCDGEVVLRSLVLAVVPMQVYEADVPHSATERQSLPIFICGSVLEGGRIESAGEIYVQGDVVESDLRSKGGTITILGTTIGSAQRPCVIQARDDVRLGHVRLARVIAGTDIHVQVSAWQCALEAGGNLYLGQSLQKALQDVRLAIVGAVFPQIEPRGSGEEIVHERQHVRAACLMEAAIAVHDPVAGLTFRGCTIVDISAGGARCSFSNAEGTRLVRGALLQIKTTLPDETGQLIALGRVVWVHKTDTFGLTFVQLAQRDQDRLIAYCFREMQTRPGGHLASVEERGRGHHAPKPETSPPGAGLGAGPES